MRGVFQVTWLPSVALRNSRSIYDLWWHSLLSQSYRQREKPLRKHRCLFFKDERINQEFKDVYARLYATSKRYVDIVKALGTRIHGMTRRELAEAVGFKLGGTFRKILDNLHELGFTREYPRYGKERVETVYQLKDFFSMFYLYFIQGKGIDAGNWRTIQRTPTLYAWAGYTFEMLCVEHLPQIMDKLHIANISRNYC